MAALVLSYIWIWQGAFRGDFLLVAVLYLAIGCLGHRVHGESLRSIGLRMDNWAAAVRNACVVVAVGIFLTLAAGAALGAWHFEAFHLLAAIPWMIVWGTAQQYGLLCILYRRFLDILPGTRLATVAAATLFAIFHVPNLLLIGVTFVAGIASCILYRRVPNVFVLGLGHASISFALLGALPFKFTHHMRVGPGYFLLH